MSSLSSKPSTTTTINSINEQQQQSSCDALLLCWQDSAQGFARLDSFPAASDLLRLYTTTDGCGEHTQQSSGGDNVINVHRQISTCPSGASVTWASPLVYMLGAWNRASNLIASGWAGIDHTHYYYSWVVGQGNMGGGPFVTLWSVNCTTIDV